MSKSNAERQAEYRRRHLHDPEGTLERINALVSLQAKRQLERLAAYYGVTKREVLERVLAEAEHAALDALPAGDPGAYYYKRLTVTPPRDGVNT